MTRILGTAGLLIATFAIGIGSATAKTPETWKDKFKKVFNYAVHGKGTIHFVVDLFPGGTTVTYTENAKIISVSDGHTLAHLVFDCMVDSWVELGEFGKFEGTKLKSALERGFEFTRKPYVFKAAKKAGCPNTHEYKSLGDVGVRALIWPEDSNHNSTVCLAVPGISVSDTISSCIAKIDKADNAYR